MAKGDQIYVYREWIKLDGVYEHHGIDCGNNTVIHYRKPSEVVELTSLKTFARGNKVFLKEYPTGFCFTPDIVVQRAKSRLGEKKYNILFNNCEHFATWCKTGINNSNQIKNFIPLIKKFNNYKLFQVIEQAFKKADKKDSQSLLKQAIDDIKVVWDRIQPEYKKTLDEINTWQQVAQNALNQNREDLAREALKKKRVYEEKARDLHLQLDKLANMTQNLLVNDRNLKS